MIGVVEAVGLIDSVEVGSVSVQFWDHRDVSQIEDNFQFVIESEIDLQGYEAFVIQDMFNDGGNHRVDGFIADPNIGCRERTLIEHKHSEGDENGR